MKLATRVGTRINPRLRAAGLAAAVGAAAVACWWLVGQRDVVSAEARLQGSAGGKAADARDTDGLGTDWRDESARVFQVRARLAAALRSIAEGNAAAATSAMAPVSAAIEACRSETARVLREHQADPAVPLLASYAMDAASGAPARLADGGPYGTHGTIAGETRFEPGVSGQSLRFDGKTTKALVESAPGGVFDLIADELTISAWINPDSADAWMPIVAKRDAYAGPEPFGFTAGSGGVLRFTGYHGGGWYDLSSPPAPIKPKQWTHVAVTFSAGEGLVFYVNAKEVGRHDGAKVARSLRPNEQPLCIGWEWRWDEKKKQMVQQGFAGCIDRVAIYPVALTAAQVAADSSGSLLTRKYVGDVKRTTRDRLARLDVSARVVRMAEAELKLTAGQGSEPEWTATARAATEREPSSVMEQFIDALPNEARPTALWRALRAPLPPEARAVAATVLAADYAPEAAAPIAEVREFYEEVVASVVDAPAAGEGLLTSYVNALDARGESALADQVLDGFIATVPDTAVGAAAAVLRCDAGPAEERHARVLALTESYRGTAVAAALRERAAQAHVAAKRFYEAAGALDQRGTLAQAKSKKDAVEALATLFHGTAAGRGLSFARSRAADQRDWTVASPLEMSLGLAAQLAGPEFLADAFRLTSGDAESLPTHAAAAPPREVLLRLFQRATIGVPFDRVQSVFAARNQQDAAAPAVASQDDAKASFQRSLLRARLLRSARKTSEASAVYAAMLDEFAADPAMVAQVRRHLVQSLLQSQPLDVPRARKEVASLRSADPAAAGEAWDYSCRLACLAVAAAPPESRASTWRDNLPAAEEDGYEFEPETLDAVDAAVRATASGGGLAAADLLRDLILQTPGRESLARLLARRAEVASAADVALKAKRLELAIATTTKAGPGAAARRYEAMLREEGADPRVIESVRGQFVSTSPSVGSSSKSPASGSSRPRDTRLEDDARAALGAGASSGPRRRAYLSLFSGNSEDALREAASALAGAGERDVPERFDDAMAILAAASLAGVSDSVEFARWCSSHGEVGFMPTDPEARVIGELLGSRPVRPDAGGREAASDVRAEVLRASVRRWGQRALAWGLTALDAGDAETGALLVAAGIRSQGDRSNAAALVDLLFEKLTTRGGAAAPAGATSASLVLMDSIAASLPEQAGNHLRARLTTHRRAQDMELIRGLFAEGKYADCIAALDQLERLLPSRAGAEDISAGFMRVLCLLKLERDDDAVAWLGRMQTWPGTDDQHARCLFLIGWTELQRDRTGPSKRALDELIARYPQTSFAEKAKKLIESME